MSAGPVTTETVRRPVPGLGPLRTARLPRVSERTLDSGLRVLAVRQPGVPLVEVRLRVPFAGRSAAHPARAGLLAETFFSGTAQRSAEDIAGRLQGLGASLSAGVDADHLSVGGTVLAPELLALLDLLAELLTQPAYPKSEVEGDRGRLVQHIAVARSQPGTRAHEALHARLYGDHPYGRVLPEPDDLEAVTPARLRSLHRDQVAPDRALLVLVGDLRPAAALDRVAQALQGWASTGKARTVPPLPAHRPGPVVLVDRPGSVQTTIRMGGPATRRTDPDYAACKLANLVFGGYFSSRLVANIRERRGYTYSPRSVLDHSQAGSALLVAADVATEVTAPALLEVAYELGRLATLPVTTAELDAARRYAVGALALSVSTQAGLASTLTALTLAGLDVGYLREHPKALATADVDGVRAAGRAYLSPAALVTVLLGDAARIRDEVAALCPVE